MPRYGMVIDLQKCVGCGSCAIACKTENNTQDRSNGQTFNWADYKIEMKGKFPNIDYSNMPVLCNHCTEASCVEACPVDCIHPRIDEENFEKETMLYIDPEECIDCGACVPECPVEAIFPEDEVPEQWEEYIEINYKWFENKA